MLVVPVVDSIGQYGGTWRRAFTGIKDFHAWGRINYDPMLRWPRDPNDPVQPGIAKAWEWSADGKAVTLFLRKGLKWSDGAPFSVDDILFWWEAIETDTNLTAAPHGEWMVGGAPMELEKIDDLTLTLKFAAPNGMAETLGLAFHGNQWPLGFERFGFFAPRHYLEQFHPHYNSALSDYAVFEEKAFDYNVERPVVTPWMLSKWEDGGSELVMTRNPYYWKVDPAGKQLPYIDTVHFARVKNGDAVNLLAMIGKIDMQQRHIDPDKWQVYQDNAERGGYHMALWNSADASAVAFFPNQSYGDPKYRELMQNFTFRQALSLAIDRDRINEVLRSGQATPRNITVIPDSPLYIPELEDYMTEFVPEQANALLDEIGLPVGSDGFRTFADGSPIELVVEVGFMSGSRLKRVQLTIENWQALRG
ncbi:MAG: hypothetical protein GY952_09340 [Rhodobacteraceae bacterium]|nr:hypothetical protein [Paracoccaceae bacterium]